MKSFLISIHPGWIIKIFNGDKTAEIRRIAPKDWKDYLSGKTQKKPEPMTGYIYCTKGNPYVAYINGKLYTQSDGTGRGPAGICFNGKVVAKFTLMEVERFSKIKMFDGSLAFEGPLTEIISIYENACLSLEQLLAYCKIGDNYAWHISDLEIFDRPWELGDGSVFREVRPSMFSHDEPFDPLSDSDNRYVRVTEDWNKPIYKAPQSWCYVEVQR